MLNKLCGGKRSLVLKGKDFTEFFELDDEVVCVQFLKAHQERNQRELYFLKMLIRIQMIGCSKENKG